MSVMYGIVDMYVPFPDSPGQRRPALLSPHIDFLPQVNGELIASCGKSKCVGRGAMPTMVL